MKIKYAIMSPKIHRKKIMKVAIQCQDIMLERALQLFLKEYLARKKDCDFIITDEKIKFEKPQFLINKYSSQLAVPFSKEQLIRALSDFDNALKNLAAQLANEKIKALEQQIEQLADEFRKGYQSDIDKAVATLKQTMIALINKERA